jgi:sugar O-acyltransferase (sialic acid O-acetyltransferase NeuD family)
MINPRLLILGAGGHGRVVADCARAIGRWSEIAFLDADWPERRAAGSWPVIGRDRDCELIAQTGDEFFVAVGQSATRRRLLSELLEAGLTVTSIRHPATIVSQDVEIGTGTVVVAGAIINIGSRIGSGCIINTGAIVDHDCYIADGVHVCPGARLAGHVTVGEDSWIGIGATIRQGISIGSNVTVGAGGVVVQNLNAGVTAVGLPAKPC